MKKREDPAIREAKRAAARSMAAAKRADQREGRVLKAATFVDRKKQASRLGCRGVLRHDG